jgi:hypothetical protein
LTFESWVYWARKKNEFVIKQADFFEALERRGYQQAKIKGERCFRGLRLKTSFSDNWNEPELI